MKLPLLSKPKMSVYLILLALVLAAMVMLHRCSNNPTHPDRSGGDTIEVAIGYAPMSLYMYDDTLGGFEYDLLRLISKHYGVAMKIRPMTSFSESLDMLDNGLRDIVVAQVAATTELKENYLLTDPVFIDRQVLIQREDSTGNITVRSQLDLAQRTICVVKDSPTVSRISNLAREIGDSIYTQELDKSQEQLFLLVAAGEVEFAVINDKIAESIVNYFDKPANRQLVDRLRQAGLQFSRNETEETPHSDKLSGLSIVISGVIRHHSRDEYKELIERNGGKNAGSISSKTSFILAGENMGPKKLEDARKKGIRIMSEDEFLAMLQEQ